MRLVCAHGATLLHYNADSTKKGIFTMLLRKNRSKSSALRQRSKRRRKRNTPMSTRPAFGRRASLEPLEERRMLSVDPGWLIGLGEPGGGNVFADNMALDSASNSYVTGSFEGTVDFDPGPGTTNLTSAGGATSLSRNTLRPDRSCGPRRWEGLARMGCNSFKAVRTSR